MSQFILSRHRLRITDIGRMVVSACYGSISEAEKILVPQDKFPRSYGESKTIHLKHFLLWAGLRDDVNHGTDARGLARLSVQYRAYYN